MSDGKKKKPFKKNSSPVMPRKNHQPSHDWAIAAIWISYIAAVLAIDTLAASDIRTPIDWDIFSWHSSDVYTLALRAGIPDTLVSWMNSEYLQRFDLFKFIMWLVVPFSLSFWKMDWAAFGIKNWKKTDVYFLAALAALGMAAMALIPHIPSLSRTYQGVSSLSSGEKLNIFLLSLTWIASWLPGWEFMLRYVLLRRASMQWPKYGWIIIPVFEGLYHLQKPIPEAIGMVALSVLLTQWTLRRRNILLPFLVHLVIELELLMFLLLS